MKAIIRKPVAVLIVGLIVGGCFFTAYKHMEHKFFVIVVQND
jgi:hypothetical protein